MGSGGMNPFSAASGNGTRAWAGSATVGEDGRTLRVASAVIRIVALGQVWIAVPLIWGRLARPAAGLGLAALLTAAAALVLYLERRRGAPTPHTLALDLPVGVIALVSGAWVCSRSGFSGWSYFAYPYTGYLTLTFGSRCRRLPWALANGAVFGVTYAVVAVATRQESPVPAVGVVVTYLVNAVLGWICAHWLRRTNRDLRRARQEAVTQAAEVAVGRERARHARAVHDHVLQTFETVARMDAIADPGLRGQVAADAAWLRDFVRWGNDSAGAELRQGLVRAAVSASKAGLDVRIQDAALADPAALTRVPLPVQRELTSAVEAVFARLAGTARRLAVRVEPTDNSARIVIVVTDPSPAQVAAPLAGLGTLPGKCRLTIADDGVMELTPSAQ
ncbi:hypothetical protein [Microbispora siamensis]|nr:hypothetical protein [Microbispora siamensis]